MSYISKLEDELRQKLVSGQSTDTIVKWVSIKILDSFKNGCAAGKADKANGKTTSGVPVPLKVGDQPLA